MGSVVVHYTWVWLQRTLDITDAFSATSMFAEFAYITIKRKFVLSVQI